MSLRTELNELNASYKSLVSSKFIIAEKKISDFIATIVKNELLYKTMEYCLVDFDYQLEFVKSKVDSNDGKGSFLILPKDRKKSIAFVFCLLSEFDKKIRDFQNFLEEFYSDKSCFDAYSTFCATIITAFVNSFESLIMEISQNSNELPKVQQEDFFGIDFASISSGVESNIINFCDKILVELNDIKDIKERQELTFLLSAFKNAVITKDRKLIKALFFGLKNSLKSSKNTAFYIASLENTLINLWIL